MNRLGLGLASMALALVGACGGSGSDEPAPAGEAKEKVSLADSCPKVQNALDHSAYGDSMLTERSQFASFAYNVDLLVDDADEKAVSILEEVAARSHETAEEFKDATGTKKLEAATEWLNTYQRFGDACQAVGSPIRLPIAK